MDLHSHLILERCVKCVWKRRHNVKLPLQYRSVPRQNKVFGLHSVYYTMRCQTFYIIIYCKV